jgi:hypothetical protein
MGRKKGLRDCDRACFPHLKLDSDVHLEVVELSFSLSF